LTDGGGVLTENKSEAFAREVVDILADSERQRELSSQARRAVERYSITDAAARMLNAYEAALDSWESRDQER
jgi:glycosyltransferase involved in cell wall biosynthesis